MPRHLEWLLVFGSVPHSFILDSTPHHSGVAWLAAFGDPWDALSLGGSKTGKVWHTACPEL
jgi:hypothetical protein